MFDDETRKRLDAEALNGMFKGTFLDPEWVPPEAKFDDPKPFWESVESNDPFIVMGRAHRFIEQKLNQALRCRVIAPKALDYKGPPLGFPALVRFAAALGLIQRRILPAFTWLNRIGPHPRAGRVPVRRA